MVHVGVDLHKRVSQIAVLTAEGVLTQHRMANNPDGVHRFFAQLPSPARVAIEASGTWWWLVDLLNTQDQGPIGRAQVQALDVADFLDEERVFRELKQNFCLRTLGVC